MVRFTKKTFSFWLLSLIFTSAFLLAPQAGAQEAEPKEPAAEEVGNSEQEARRALQRELARLRNREMRARREINIFSPLDLPTPNEARTAIGLPGPGYWQQHVDYQMEVNLDDQADKLVGRETITYTNHSPTPLPYLWLNLEQNLFREIGRAHV